MSEGRNYYCSCLTERVCYYWGFFFSGNMLFHLKKIASLTSKARAETEEALTATQQDRGSLYTAKRTNLNACYKYLN